ncbi:mycofactocin oligosaccharide methyltransferase MftM [Gordonia sp. (in: high G+C Gram-positive bacteria)]|uniref:mycofactocin oligosaccharide methyltransferase MftM n=1 Tax=Gordonia sp. (in: high G+C Gram-positive bacteria) TaxID=84139 RepID=UPI002629445C|nr:mycofactocin oligosaccharide methyltransferase MftM [Gordonia sp. (in: high G+C Gram-positive bacteria)]
MTVLDQPVSSRRIHVQRLPTHGNDEEEAIRFQFFPNGNLVLSHRISTRDLCDDLVVALLGNLIDRGVLAGQHDFEDAAVRLIESVGTSIDESWNLFYDNTLESLEDGTAEFAPIHQRARELVRGDSVLDVGSCFGFFALTLARSGRTVAACDISPGAVRLLRRAADRLGLGIDARPGDATDLPYPDDAFDTVTLIHLLEHLDAEAADTALREALRVARRRVVIAVPFEVTPTEHFGHRTTITEATVRRWAEGFPEQEARCFTEHGGWLVLDHHAPHPTSRGSGPERKVDGRQLPAHYR